MKIVYFHNPNEENGFLSNWFLCSFLINEQTFTSIEQYMMYQKAIRFNDLLVASQIMATNDTATIKGLGRAVSGYDDSIWSAVREQVVYDASMAKYSQNPDLKRQLLATNDSLLAECAVNDLIWGIGLAMDDVNRFDIKKWRGKNLLGKTLMKVREHLQ